MEEKYFPYFGKIPYIRPEVYIEDQDAEYFTAFGEWDIVRLSDGSFAYTQLGGQDAYC